MSPEASTFELIPVTRLLLSKSNPRQRMYPKGLVELTTSIQAKGVLVPLLVRPFHKPDRDPNLQCDFEIVAGARRYQAALQAGLDQLPCLIRSLSDLDVLETQLIENLQREGIHPLDEAEGYKALMGHSGYHVDKIAARVGRSVKYVYDRMKLLALTKEARDCFWSEQITAGHAILLARLTAADQTRSMDPETGGLWDYEKLLWDPESDEVEDNHRKAVSVRELQAWIDEHVKFDAKAADPMLFPETVDELEIAKGQGAKIVPITYDHFVQPDARDGQKVFGPRSWKRADGKHHSLPCEKSVTGIVVVGPRRGEAFKICMDKKGCKTHYAAEQKAAAKKLSGVGGAAKTQAALEKQLQQQAEANRQRNERRDRWVKATPAILEAVASRVKTMPTKATGCLAEILISEVESYQFKSKKGASYVGRGTTAEDALRHAAFLVLASEVTRWGGAEEFPKRAKMLGLDITEVLDAAVPVTKESKAPSAAKKPKAKK